MMKYLLSIVLLIIACFPAFGAINTNIYTHCLTNGTGKPLVKQWDFCFMANYNSQIPSNKKSHEQFLKDLWNKNEHYRNGDFWVVGKYTWNRQKLLLEDKYGLSELIPSNLLRGCKPEIHAAIDKTTYFKNILFEKNKHYRDGKFEVIGEYFNRKTKILCKDKYGLLEFFPQSLLNGSKPTVKSVEKNIKNSMKHKRKNMSCGYSDSDWEQLGLTSNRFDSFKVYIIKCWNDTETFYKIGKTFNTVGWRFKGKEDLPYKYEVLSIIINDAKSVCILERKLHKQHKKYKYLPKKKFGGMLECFSFIDHNIINQYV